MAGTRTAGAINGTPSYKRVSISLIDAQGDIRSVSYVADAALTDAQVETLIATTQTGSNASIYSVNIQSVYEGARNKSNADDAVVNSLFSNIVYHVKASPTSSQRGYLPAPPDSFFTAGTDDPDPTNTDLTAWFSAVLAVVGAAYSGQTVRYTERREINDAIKL